MKKPHKCGFLEGFLLKLMNKKLVFTLSVKIRDDFCTLNPLDLSSGKSWSLRSSETVMNVSSESKNCSDFVIKACPNISPRN